MYLNPTHRVANKLLSLSLSHKYVDDSTLFEICDFNSISLMQESVNIAAEWTNNNDMKINSEKSKEMIISYAHGNIGNEVPNILIEGKFVERVDHVKVVVA